MNVTTGSSERRAIAKIYERDMDLVLVEELESSSEFRMWLVARVFGIDCFHSHLCATHSVTDDSSRESDVVFRFHSKKDNSSELGAVKAILLENKIDAVAQPNQGQDYGKRGRTGVDRGEWVAFKSCLVAPKAYLKGALDKSNFDECVSYEEILAYFASRRERDERFKWKVRLVESAIFKKESGYTPTISAEATAFVREYFERAKAFPRLQMPDPKPRPSGSTWISFRPGMLPRNSSIEHQITAGAVKLLVPGAADKLDELKALIRPFLAAEMDIELAGRSVAVSIKVPSIEAITVPFSTVCDKAVAGMVAADALAEMIELMRARGLRIE